MELALPLRRRPRAVYRVYSEDEYLSGADPFPDWETPPGADGQAKRGLTLQRLIVGAALAGVAGTVGGAIGLAGLTRHPAARTEVADRVVVSAPVSRSEPVVPESAVSAARPPVLGLQAHHALSQRSPVEVAPASTHGAPGRSRAGGSAQAVVMSARRSTPATRSTASYSRTSLQPAPASQLASDRRPRPVSQPAPAPSPAAPTSESAPVSQPAPAPPRPAPQPASAPQPAPVSQPAPAPVASTAQSTPAQAPPRRGAQGEFGFEH
jgi:hypothetical protein